MQLSESLNQVRIIIGEKTAEAIGLPVELRMSGTVAAVERAFSDLEPRGIGLGVVIADEKAYREALVGAATAEAIMCDEAADAAAPLDLEYHGNFGGENFSLYSRSDGVSGAVVFVSVPQANIDDAKEKMAAMNATAVSVDIAAPGINPTAVYALTADGNTLYVALCEEESDDEEWDEEEDWEDDEK